MALPTDPSVKLYLDGAHTRESLALASTWFDSSAPAATSERVLLFYCKQNRDPHALLASVVRSGLRFSRVIFSTEALHARTKEGDSEWQQTLASTWRELGGSGDVQVTPSLSDALHQLTQVPHRPLHVFVTGSLYLVGGALKLVGWEW